jgi:hypothetical protein
MCIIPKWGKINQMAIHTHYTIYQMAICTYNIPNGHTYNVPNGHTYNITNGNTYNIPNGHSIHIPNDHSIFIPNRRKISYLQDPPKFFQIGIFCLKI